MNVIDISNWQVGIDLDRLYRENPLDAVIVKATQGTGYVNPCFGKWAGWLKDNGKRMGLYHYLDLHGARAEARHFAKIAAPYTGRAVFVCDYEGNTVRKGTGYLKEWLDEVYSLTGVKPLVYVSQSFIQTQDFGAIAGAGYGLWVAQYADTAIVRGFLDAPWHSGSVAPFKRYVMQQYTGTGRLNGWDNDLDLDKFFGTEQDWDELCGTGAVSGLKGPDPLVVSEVLANRYGTGSERREKLLVDGYDPDAVQAKINELYAAADKCRPYCEGNKEYLNSIVKLIRGKL